MLRFSRYPLILILVTFSLTNAQNTIGDKNDDESYYYFNGDGRVAIDGSPESFTRTTTTRHPPGWNYLEEGESCMLADEKASLEDKVCVPKSKCILAAPACRNNSFNPLGGILGYGRCVCDDGYTANQYGVCKKGIQLGQTCDENDSMCLPNKSSCRAGVCACNSGYKIGPNGDCVLILETAKLNEFCYHSDQCFDKMACIFNKCSCPAGFIVGNNFKCIEKRFGDTCRSHDDCSQIPNSRCNGGLCLCGSGFRQVTISNSTEVKKQVCIADGDRLLGETEPCDHTSPIGRSGTRLCAAPLVCTGCNSDTLVCTAPLSRRI